MSTTAVDAASTRLRVLSRGRGTAGTPAEAAVREAAAQLAQARRTLLADAAAQADEDRLELDQAAVAAAEAALAAATAALAEERRAAGEDGDGRAAPVAPAATTGSGAGRLDVRV